MKKLSVLIGALLLVGCSKPNPENNNAQAEPIKVEAKKDLLTENEKAFLKFSVVFQKVC